jgi:hypothetical protein
MARGTLKKNRRRTTTGAPAPKISRSQAFFQEIFGESVPRGTSQSWHDFCLRKMFSKNNIKRPPKLSNQLQSNKPRMPPLKISFFGLLLYPFPCYAMRFPKITFCLFSGFQYFF